MTNDWCWFSWQDTPPLCRLQIDSNWRIAYQSYLYLAHSWINVEVYSVSQKNPPKVFWHLFPNGWEFFVQTLHACYTFLSTLDCNSFIQLSHTMTKLCHIKRDHHYMLKMSTIGCNARWVVALQSINQSNFIMKCDKRTQNIESSVRMTMQKNIKKTKQNKI